MNIIFSDVLGQVPENYVVLELDKIRLPDNKVITSYCVLDQIPLHELMTLEHYRELHNTCVSNYRQKHWDTCEKALQQLKGRWNKQVDSFYEILEDRIANLKNQTLSKEWDGIVDSASNKSSKTLR